MVELGGMLAAAILKVVADQISSALGGQIKLQKNFEKELKKMKMALESVDAVLKVSERRSITDEPTLLWLKRLKDAMYAISDTIDEFEADMEAISKPSAHKFSFKKYTAFMTPCLTIGPKITMANKMEKMREGLEVITNQHNTFKLAEGTSADEPKLTDIRETSSTLETQIIGRTEDKEEILSSLFDNMSEEITVLPIYGIGGLGKTTLAKMVYNSSQFKEYSQVWVYVSQNFDLKKIGNSIISQLSQQEKESEYTGMQMIHNSLQKLLADKKILIVLDDLWQGEQSHLESLMDMLRVGKGSNVVVIVTTRDEGIAKKISTIQPYKLVPLSDDMCWSIIKQKSAFESRGDKEQLEKIGRDIAMKCVGVALAAKSLGHMLQSMNSSDWESVRDSNIWNVSSLRDTSSTQVLASLKLSYSVMPSHLKLCFAYCAIFPKGHKIVKDALIHQWVSLGFSTWQLGERYISQLLGLSFLEHTKSTSTINLYYEDDILLTMHDLVHDLARSVMDDEIIVAGKGNNAEGSCYHYALLDDCSKPLGSEASRIRALRFMDCDKTELHDAAFSSAKSLRVLDLSECTINKLPESIGALKQLRYLNAPNVQHAIIPNSLTRLPKLIYLDLHGSSKIITLPESIGEIEGLSYLDLSGCSEITKLPESFGKLKELVHLDFSKCYLLRGISELLGSLTQLKYLNLSYCHHIGKLPEAMRGLSKLKYLNLSFSSYLDCCEEAEVLGSLNELEYLNLSSECCDLKNLPETLGFIQLKYFNLSGCEVIQELPKLQILKSLVHLDLSYCHMIESLHKDLVGLSSLEVLNLESTPVRLLPDDLTKLRYLNLSDLIGSSVDTFDSLITHIGVNLSNLEHLDLSDNSCIGSIPESLCSLRKLHTLDLSNCTLLKTIPKSLRTIDSLKFLYLNGCPNIVYPPKLSSSSVSLPHFVVYSYKGDTSSNLVQLQHIDPVELQISKLENVNSISEAHRINLMEKHNLQNLKLEWTRDVEGFVDAKMLLNKLVPPSTLENLEIRGYNGVSFPAWLVGQLPNLQKLVLCDMASLVEWNTSYSIGEEHVIEELNIYDCPMLRMKPLPPKAKYWHIYNSDDVLSSWEELTDASSFSSPVTTRLLVSYCQVPLHQWRLLQRLSGLTYLYIHNCGDLTSSPEIIQYLSSLETLCLQDKELEELPNWLGELTSLQSLEIIECGELKKFSENMRKLTKLRSLKLFLCNRMESLPHWLGELTSLNKLAVEGCGVLKSLPESMQQLTSLQELEISSCHELKHMFESTKGSLKFTPNHERVCGLPTSLKELKIRACYGIRSLPEGIYQLTGLQKLEISLCHQLKHVVESEEGNMKLTHTQERVCGLPTSLKELEIRYCGGIQSLPEGMRQLTNLQNLHIQGCNSLWEWCELKENKDMLKQLEKLVYHSVSNNSTSRASRDIEDTSDNRARMSLLMGDEESDRHRQKTT